MKLMIAIPTYNRNQILSDNLRVLLPQLTDECQVRIFDNCSQVPVSHSLQPLLDCFPEAVCEIIRNPVNIGANANIMHCFETCGTEWLWVIGDDDTVTSGAVAKVLSDIARFPEALFVGYATAAYPIQDAICRGLAGFVAGMESFSNTLFLSAGIYRTGALAAGLRIGYQFAYSGAPHLAALLMCLDEQSQTCFSSDEIVLQNAPDNAAERWSLAAHALAVGTLFDLPLPAPVRDALAVKVLATFPTTEQIVMQLVLLAVKEGDARTAMFCYTQILVRLYCFDTSPARRIKRALYRLLLRFPRLGYFAVRLAYRATRKKEVSSDLLHDQFARL